MTMTAAAGYAAGILALGLAGGRTEASIAYGTLNNFDCVNDTGVEAHGFDIQLDDLHSTDITYTYDYNHYGVPKITEDNSVPAHPKVLVRYAGARMPDGTWTAYTAIPAGPIAPTQGHQFTDPSVNFGGEHFGVGYSGNPSAVNYSWLIDDGAGNLVHGPPVNVTTPTFTYNAPAAAVVAVVVPPPPPAPPPLQFGDACWVKQIKTTTHNPAKVHLHDLVGDDEGKPQPWANGEPPEVETEWKLLQTEFANAANPKGVLQGLPENLPGGDEIITRRYEHYRYIGPSDAETGEAMADSVGALAPDGISYYGSGSVTYADYFDFIAGEWHTTTTDLSTVLVVGEFFGAQMAGFDVAPNLGLIDNLQDGEPNAPYGRRALVVGGNTPYNATLTSGALPNGLSLDQTTGVLSGTPDASGVFAFNVDATDADKNHVAKQFLLKIPSGVTTSRSGFRYNRAKGRFVQNVTVTHAGAAALSGPVSLVLKNLSANATVANKAGTTAVTLPVGSPYLDVNLGAGIAPGQSVTVTVEFDNPTYKGISYDVGVQTGPGVR